MDLSTTYLGLDLPHPLMPGASPLVHDLDRVKGLEDAGSAAIVMHSLFEEQIGGEQSAAMYHFDAHSEAFGEALTFQPGQVKFAFGPDEYLEHLRQVKEAVGVPVIGSLNGVTASGWLDHARLIEQAGADALELNIYFIASDPKESSAAIEARMVDIVRAVRESVSIPIAVKLSAYFTSFAHVAQSLVDAGANGLVVFNRFYQPDLDVEELAAMPSLQLSSSADLPLRVQWLALLSGRVDTSLAVSGGVHTALDAVKAIMAGADAVQLVSALLRNGPSFLRKVRDDLEAWLEEHEYKDLKQAKGSLNYHRCPDPAVFERGNYARILQSWSF